MFDENYDYTWKDLKCPLCGGSFDLQFVIGGMAALDLTCLQCHKSFLLSYDCKPNYADPDFPFSIRVHVDTWDINRSRN